MPWTSKDAKRHTKKAKTPKKQRQWAHVADSALQRTGDEGLAIREANGVVARHADGGEVSPLESVLGHGMGLGNPMGGGSAKMPGYLGSAHMRMPHIPIADTLHRIDQNVHVNKLKMPKVQNQAMKMPRMKFARGGAEQLAALKHAMASLQQKDASSASATMRRSPGVMSDPRLATIAGSLQRGQQIGPASQALKQRASAPNIGQPGMPMMRPPGR